MVDVQRTFVVSQPVQVVTDYLRDFTHSQQWDPGTRSCRQTSAQEVGVGTTWVTTTEAVGREIELTVTLTADESGHLRFVGTNKNAVVTQDMLLLAEGEDRTVVNYRVNVTFNGLAKLAQPVVQRELDRLADDIAEHLTTSVDGLSAS